ncbi:MAG: hypothetical protein Q4P24_08465 [Rhodobacterales bacterium]|nr:hypothetical protein [Rhodobacterales bacterium]
MADKENGSEKKKRWPITILVFLVVLLLLLLLFYRSPAEAQEDFDVVDEKISISISNLRAIGVEADAKILGPLSENPEFVSQMKSPEEPALYFDGQELHILNVADMAERSGDYEGFLQAVAQEIDGAVAELSASDTWAIEYYVQGRTAHVALSGDIARSRGVFSDMSRIAFQSVYPNGHPDQPVEFSSACSRKVLTRNIFGQDAEWVRICVEAQCQARAPETCEIYDKSWDAWYFGKVEFVPPDRPEDGNIYGALCRGRGYYNWSVSFAGLKLFGHEAQVEGLEWASSGHLTSETMCGE